MEKGTSSLEDYEFGAFCEYVLVLKVEKDGEDQKILVVQGLKFIPTMETFIPKTPIVTKLLEALHPTQFNNDTSKTASNKWGASEILLKIDLQK